MPQGNIKWFSIEKGYGFIVPDEGGKDIFVHRSSIDGLDGEDGLREGERVEYEVETTPKGVQASNVTRQDGSIV